MNIESSATILRSAISEIKPTYVVSMVSGGKDSAASHAICEELGIKIDLVVHGKTGTGIPDTTEFVTSAYGSGSNDFAIADAGTAYEDYVIRKGFFGKGRAAHGFSYRILKATPFRKALSKLLRQKRRGIRILLINGARRDESANRQARLQVRRPDPAAPNNIWVNPLQEWTQDDRDEYLVSRNVPINPVAKALCRSGECMCGTMQTPEERIEAAMLYPDWGQWLTALEEEVRRLHGWGWGEAFPRKRSEQADLFQPMCVGCMRSSDRAEAGAA